MNILLVMPRNVKKKDDFYLFPMGIAYVSAALKETKRHNVHTINLNHIWDEDVEDIINHAVMRWDISVVGTGGLTQEYPMILNVVLAAKRAKKDMIVAVGGGYITSDPEAAMESIPEIDIGMIGEGEETIVELMDTLEKHLCLENVAGLIYRDRESGLVTTCPREEIKDLDKLPYPDYEGFSFGEYVKLTPEFTLVGFKKGTATIITGRSCPFHCTFCFHPSGTTYRIRSLDSVFYEIDWLLERYEIHALAITDELFAADKERLREFCERIKKYNLIWWVNLRVTSADYETLKLMKEAGCCQILYGIESADDRILKSMGKLITVEQIETALENATKAGILCSGNLIFGDAQETLETARNTLNWWKRHREYCISPAFIILFPGSGLYQYAIEKNLYQLGTIKGRVEHIKKGCPLRNISRMTDDEYRLLTSEINQELERVAIPIDDVAVKDIKWENRHAKIEGRCHMCGRKNVWRDVSIGSQGRYLKCEYCNCVHNNNYTSLYYPTIVKNMKILHGHYKKMALWGLGMHVMQLFQEYREIQEIDLMIFDKSEVKWGEIIWGKTVHNPEELTRFGIDCLIITAPDNREQQVAEEFQLITGGNPDAVFVCTLTEIMNPHFFDDNSEIYLT